MIKSASLFLFVAISLGAVYAQNRIQGPVIKDFGGTFAIEDPDFKTDPDKVYKVVFDIHDTPENPGWINPQLNTLARFINMHVHAGVPLENLQVACVFHNKATKDVMDNASYKAKYGVDNPNVPLMEALDDAGADIYFCGQSMYARGLKRDKLAKPVKVGLSAMTVILSLEQEGYHLIKF